MALQLEVLNRLTQGSPSDAWGVIVDSAVEIASKPLAAGNAPSEVIKRDREIGALDNFLSASGWDLWESFGTAVERTSDRLARWWAEPYSAKAVLVLDGLSLRELPWLLQGAKDRGFKLHEVPAAFEHFNEVQPQSSLRTKSPRDFRWQWVEQSHRAYPERPALHWVLAVSETLRARSLQSYTLATMRCPNWTNGFHRKPHHFRTPFGHKDKNRTQKEKQPRDF